eukprot:scaffold157941_cov22-Prasinocladus_malaysianus.AAC.1
MVSPDEADEVTTIRRFEFDHGRQTMSVVVRFKDGTAHAFLKGSFERVGQMAHPASLPEDYMDNAQVTMQAVLHDIFGVSMACKSPILVKCNERKGKAIKGKG